jgi:hypothetical protein
MTTGSSSCGSMVSELSVEGIIRRRRVMFGIEFVKSLHEKKEKDGHHVVTFALCTKTKEERM